MPSAPSYRASLADVAIHAAPVKGTDRHGLPRPRGVRNEERHVNMIRMFRSAAIHTGAIQPADLRPGHYRPAINSTND